MVCLLANYYKVSIDYMIGFSENKKKNYNFDSYNKKILCNRLYNARKRKKLSQQSIANIIGCSQRVYSGYESGYAVIPFSKLCTLCEYYNVSLDYMIGRSNDNDVKVLMHQ